MNKATSTAVAVLVGCLVLGAIIQSKVKHQALVLGLSPLELAVLSAAAGAAVHRRFA